MSYPHEPQNTMNEGILPRTINLHATIMRAEKALKATQQVTDLKPNKSKIVNRYSLEIKSKTAENWERSAHPNSG